MKTLGKCLGRAEINVLCVNDKKMSNKLLSLWNEMNESVEIIESTESIESIESKENNE